MKTLKTLTAAAVLPLLLAAFVVHAAPKGEGPRRPRRPPPSPR
ncbi:MAG: hypothetical protein WDN06_19955 [Asticcacaulis sp.]